MSTPKTNPKKQQNKLPLKQKIAYGLGSANDLWGNWLYPSMVWPVFNIFLQVSPSIVSLVLMINRLVDAVSDPYFGWISDNSRSKWGRRRPFILFGSIIAGICFPLLFLVNVNWNETALMWFMIISSGIFITIVSGYNVPYHSLGQELTPDYHERTSVFSYRTVIQKVPELTLFFAAMFVTLHVFDVQVESPSATVHLMSQSKYQTYKRQDAVAAVGDERCKALGTAQCDAEISTKLKALLKDAPYKSAFTTAGKLALTKELKAIQIARFSGDVTFLELVPGVIGTIDASDLPDPKRVLKEKAEGTATIGRSHASDNTLTMAISFKAPDVLFGAQIYSIIIGIGIILVGIVVFAFVRERYYHVVTDNQTERTTIAETTWKTILCKPFRAQLAMSLAYGLGTSMVGSLGYYATVYYVCEGDVSLGSKWNFIMGLSYMGFAIAGVPFFNTLSKKLGKRRAMYAVQVIAILVFLSTWFLYNPEIKWLQVLASGGIAFTGAGFWMLFGSIGADVVDYDELETGKRREGAFVASGSWIMKVGMALGIGATGIILEATGFDSYYALQSEQTLTSIRLFLAGIPVIGLVLALVALSRFGLTPERMEEIRAALETRRGAV